MKSHIEIGSISIDLSKCVDDDKNDPGKCDHFTIRGYVSEVRKKDWKKCWPFPMNEPEEQPSLPPMDVPKLRRWLCLKCRQGTTTEVIHGDDESVVSCRNGCSAVVSSGIQQALVPISTPLTGEIDLNKPIDPSCGTDCLPSTNEIENNATVVNNGTDNDIGLENNLNHHISSVPQLEVDAVVINEENTNIIETGGEVGVVSNVEVATREGDATNHTIGLLSSESIAFDHVASEGDIKKIVQNDFQNHNAEKSTGLTRKRAQKTRLLSELVNKIGEVKTDKIAQKIPLVSIDNVDVQGDMTLINKIALDSCPGTVRTEGRKRKFLVDEESRCGNNETQNLEGGAKVLLPKSAVDVVNKEAPSQSPPSAGFFSRASTEKRMDGLTSHMLKIKNDFNSKGKGKMLQADKELDSLFSRKSEKLVEVSSALTGKVKNVSSMPLSSKCYSSELVRNKQSIHETEIQLPFSLHCISRPNLMRKDDEINFFREEKIPSNYMSNAISVNGKGVHLEVTNGGRNKDKTAEVIVLDSPERYRDLTTEESEHNSLDDVPMEVVEIMARNQYERSLPDVEKSTQRGKHEARDEENVMIRKEENMSHRKGNSTNYFSPLEDNQFGMNNLHHAIPYPYELGASVPWAPLTKKVASVGYDDSSKKAISQPSSSNMDLNSPWSNSLRNSKMDIDLNSPNCNIIDLEKLPTTIGSGNMGRTNAEYTSSRTNNRMEPFFGIFSSVQHGEKFRSPPDFRARNLTLCGKEEKRPSFEIQTPQQHKLDILEPLQKNLECSTMLNKNPAEFALLDEESPYMISGKDLKIEDSFPYGMPALRAPRGRPKKNMKPSKMKLNENNG